MSNAITYRMIAGVAGAITRTQEATIESGLFDSTKPFAAYGHAVVYGTSKIRPPAAGDVANNIRGFLVRPYPVQTTSNEALGTATPPTAGIADILTRGYFTAHLNAGTAAKDASPYVRIASASTGKPIGGIEAAFESGSTAIAAQAGNTGNGTASMNSTDTASGVTNGIYKAIFVRAATNSGGFIVVDPSGIEIGTGVVGTLFDGVVKFTIADGSTDFVAGDVFNITVTPNTIQIPRARFTGPADSNGITEIAFNI